MLIDTRSDVPSSRCSSFKARAGTTKLASSGITLAAMSRIAMRYESVATRRSFPSTPVIKTPVYTPRASSLLAARTTCLSASDKSLVAIGAPSPTVPDHFGKSSPAPIGTVKFTRPAEISTLSSPRSNSTAPEGSERTTSLVSFAGTKTTPSLIPETVRLTSIVKSPSVPVTRKSSPARTKRKHDNVGLVARPVDARLAAPNASARTSRSHRNFTAGLLHCCHHVLMSI